MKTLLITLACITSLVAILLLTGANGAIAADQSTTPAGKSCTIQFRRDALGAAASLPISPTSSSINGAGTSIHGTFKSIRDEWVIIDRSGREVWIPKSVILLIEF